MFSSLLLLFTLCMTVIWIVMLLIPMSLGWALLLSFLLFLVASRVRVLFLYRMRDRLQRFIECDALLSKQRIEAFRTQPSMTSSKLHELSHSERQAQLRRTLDKSDELNRFCIGHLLFNIQDQLFRRRTLSSGSHET